MGLFSGKTIINVASSVYNLAGDEKDRPIYIQNLIIRNILSGTKRSLGETVTAGYINGPGIRFRNFFRWALNNYDLIGMPEGQVYAADTLSTTGVGEQIPKDAPTDQIWVQEAFLGDSDYAYWADQYMLKYHSDIFSTAWEADMDDATKQITIKFAPSTPAKPDETFTAADFVSGAKYVLAYYTVSKAGETGPVVNGSLSSLGSSPFPSVSGYTLTSDVTTPRTERLDREETVVKSYSDGRPNENSHTTSYLDTTINAQTRVYSKQTFTGNDPVNDAKNGRNDFRNLFTNQKVVVETTTNTSSEVISGGVTRTTTTIITQEVLQQDNAYRDDTQQVVLKKWEPIQLFIYRIGSGNLVLDNLISQVADYGKFFPMIPFRLKNEFVSEKATNDIDNVDPDWKAVHKLAKKAFRKGTDGAKYDKVEANLNDSEDIDSMDYIYAVYGVSLNCIDRSARRYIYEFFDRLQNEQAGGVNSGTEFATKMAAYTAAYDRWLAWRASNKPSPDADGVSGHPQDEPYVPPKPTLPTNEIQVKSNGDSGSIDIKYDMRLIWHFIADGGEHVGKGKPAAQQNDVWIEFRGNTVVPDPIYTGANSYNGDGFTGNPSSTNKTEYGTIRIWWQFEKNRYRYLDIAGLIHKNNVYGGKHVTITAKEALEDSEESGFLVPLHYATFKAMPLVHSTQMSTACVFLVINCYEKQKTKWWQSGFFKVIFVIVVAIVSVTLTGGAGFGLLGSHMAVGSALGLSSMGAAIAGSITNALAALVLTTIIEKLTAGMGIFGQILGTVLSIVVGGAIQNANMGLGFTFNFSELMKAENIMKLMDAGGRGYTAYVQGSIEGMQKDLLKLQEEANTELARIRDQYVDQFGLGGGQIDPMMFTSASNPAQNVEMRDTFIARTLMTGSEVANMSLDLLNDMADLTLSLPNAFAT